MAKIKHIAIVTMDAPKLAEFYTKVFDMKILNTLEYHLLYHFLEEIMLTYRVVFVELGQCEEHTTKFNY